jgi:hypothetical protein
MGRFWKRELISVWVGTALAFGCVSAKAQNPSSAFADYGACVTYYSNLRYPSGFLVYPGNAALAMCAGKLTPAFQTPLPSARYTKPGTSQETFMVDRWQCYQQTGANCAAWVSCLAALGYRVDMNGELGAPPEAVIPCSR